MNHRKIAELAHVSTSTVSKALSGSKEISNEVAENIRKIALETGYFAEKNRRKLSNQREKQAQIAVICPEIISIHYSKIVTLLKSFIEERGGRIAVYIYDFDKNKKNELIESLSMDNTTDGIISISSYESNKSLGIPVVCFDINNPNFKFDTIGADIDSVMHDCVKHLYDLGHRRIGFIGESKTVSKEKRFRSALKEMGLEVCENYIFKIDKRFESIGSEAAGRIISNVDRPTAFITAYDEIAVSLIYDLEQAGLRVPGDISVIGMNDIPLAPYIKSSLTTVRFFFDEQAALAVDILYDKIFGISDEVHHLVINHELIVRDSTGIIG